MNEALLPLLSDFIAAHMALHFPAERWPELERGLRLAAREFGFADPESFAHRLLVSPLTRERLEVLASHLTVGETYFFRDRKIFQLLEEQILPELIHSRRVAQPRLRIWSAGCATGEEPYSIAILLHKLIPDLERWNITLLATDINPQFLRKASVGEYSEWSFRDMPDGIRERYFTKTGRGRYRIAPFVQRMVSFCYLNLAEDVYPSLSNGTNAMDLIFCRNVLMYFVPEQQKSVANHLHRALVEGGWLIVSPSEASHLLFSSLLTVNFPSAILYRKPGDKSAAAALFPPHGHGGSPPERSGTAGLAQVPESASVSEKLRDLPALSSAKSEGEETQPAPYQAAVRLYELGLFRQAEEKLAFWLGKNPNDATAMKLMARLHGNQGRLEQALEWCERALDADKLNTGSHYLRAMILQERGEIEEAITSLKRAVYAEPRFIMAYYALANLLLRQRKSVEAEKHFDNALSLLRTCRSEELVPESEGMTAGRLMEIIESIRCGGVFV